MAKRAETVILGEGCEYTTDCRVSGINNNVLVCGGSGSGKTMSISEPRLIQTRQTSLITTVTKRRIVNKYKPMFQKRGYQVQDLDFSDPRRGNVGYDPLFYVHDTRDITFLAQSIVNANPQKEKSTADPYWDETAVSLLSAEIAYVMLTKENPCLTDALEMHDSLNLRPNSDRSRLVSDYDIWFKALSEMPPAAPQKEDYLDLEALKTTWQTLEEEQGDQFLSLDFEEQWTVACNTCLNHNPRPKMHYTADRNRYRRVHSLIRPGRENLRVFALNCWKTFHEVPVKTASSIFVVLNTTLDNLFSPEVRELMRTEKRVNFEQLANERTVLFVTTNPVNTSLNFFINLFYGHAIKQLFEHAESRPDGTLPLPVHLLCDDFATGGRIMNFPEYISIFREKGISVTLLVQSESQLVSMYGEDAATTIINNCDSYVYLGGMDLDTARNVSLRCDVPYEEVLEMAVGEEILFRRGQNPVRTSRYNIRNNRQYQTITREYEERISQAAR